MSAHRRAIQVLIAVTLASTPAKSPGGTLAPPPAVRALAQGTAGRTIAAVADVPGGVANLVAGTFGTTIGILLTFDVSEATKRAANSRWLNRRSYTKLPRFWRAFGVLCLLFGSLLLVVGALTLWGR